MQNRGLIWLLAAVLVVQVYTVMQIGNLRTAQQQLHGDVNRQLTQMQSRVGRTESLVGDLGRANEWVLNPQLKVESGGSCTTAGVALDWSFRDLEPETVVDLLFRRAGEAQWLSAQTTSTGPLSYRAVFDVQGTVMSQPVIEVQKDLPSSGASTSARVEETVKVPGSHQYEYRVVAKSGTGERSSESKSLDLAKVFQTWLRISVSVHKDRYQVRLFSDPKPSDRAECLKVVAAGVRGYVGQQKVVEEAFDPSPQPEEMWATLPADKQLQWLEVWVRYGSGHDEVHRISL